MASAAWTREHKINLLSAVAGAVAAAALFVSLRSDSSPAPQPRITVVTAPSVAPGTAAGVTLTTPIPTASAPSKPVEYGFYPPDRATYHCDAGDCAVAPDVTIDSATDNPVVGDERPFLAGSLSGARVRNRLAVKPGDIVTVRAYVDNDADSRKLGRAAALAQNLRVSVLLPTGAQTFFNLVGFIKTDNGNPASINDPMLLVGQQSLKLDYVPGSARYSHVEAGKQVSDPMSDMIVTPQGVGFGNLEPGTANAFFITLQVHIAAA